MPVKGTPLQVPPCLFFISGCSPFKVASGRALASAVRNTYCGQGFQRIRAGSLQPMPVPSGLVTGLHGCPPDILNVLNPFQKKLPPFPAKAGNRDSIRSKVFEGDREGFGEEGRLSRKAPPQSFLLKKVSHANTFGSVYRGSAAGVRGRVAGAAARGIACGMGTGPSSACSRRW